MDIAYMDLHRVAGVPWRHEPSLLALARWADMLVVAAAGGPASRHLIDADVIDALGPAGMLVNVARGSIVDEAALVAALREGRLGAAGLDVFTDEPHVPPLTGEGQCRSPAAPGFGQRETRLAMGALVVANLEAHFSGRELPTPVR
jgi:lactate dehydrogenase-like 2-hydroxyacid dehydrogenase